MCCHMFLNINYTFNYMFYRLYLCHFLYFHLFMLKCISCFASTFLQAISDLSVTRIKFFSDVSKDVYKQR